jgi:CBS domain containing-hemolysin-like protein
MLIALISACFFSISEKSSRTFGSSKAGKSSAYHLLYCISTIVFCVNFVFAFNEILSESFNFPEVVIILTGILLATVSVSLFAEFLPSMIIKANPDLFLKIFKKEGVFGQNELSEMMTDIVEAEHEKDIRIFKNAIYFSDVKLRECMIPRNEIVSIAENADIKQLQKLFIETNYSRVLVYGTDIDDIKGYAGYKDLLSGKTTISSMLRSVDFFPETVSAQKQLTYFMKNKKSLSVVVDEFGGTSGLVTLEDLMEKIFGDIEDEHDYYDLTEKQLSPHEFIFSGRLEVEYLNEKYKLKIPESDEYETLAGYIINKYESIPEANQELVFDNYRIKILSLSSARIETVKLNVDI